MSLSRVNHWLPRGQAHPEGRQSTAEFPDQIAGLFFPQAHPVFKDAAALDTAVDMVEPQPTLVQRLVRHVLLPRERLPHIRINSNVVEQDHRGVKRITRPMVGFKAFDAAQSTLVGIELMHMLKKRQLVVEEGNKGRTAAELFYSLAA